MPEGEYYVVVSSCNDVGISSTYAEFDVINDTSAPVITNVMIEDLDENG